MFMMESIDGCKEKYSSKAFNNCELSITTEYRPYRNQRPPKPSKPLLLAHLACRIASESMVRGYSPTWVRNDTSRELGADFGRGSVYRFHVHNNSSRGLVPVLVHNDP